MGGIYYGEMGESIIDNTMGGSIIDIMGKWVNLLWGESIIDIIDIMGKWGESI